MGTSGTGKCIFLYDRDTARELNCKPQTLYSRIFRAEIGLPGVKIGRHWKFDTRDIEAAISRQRERLLVTPSEHGDDAV